MAPVPSTAPSPRRDEIVSVAGRLLDAHGPEAVTMRAIATEMGIRAPSLYKHIADKRELEVALIADALAAVADVYGAAVAGSPQPLADLARAYRAWAVDHPHRYRLMTERPLPRAELPPGLEARAAAPVIAACGGDPDRARATWAFAHGMVMLELADRFPPDADLDAAWTTGITALAIPTHSTPTPEVTR
jgi:AcrR family transcriptional regulator